MAWRASDFAWQPEGLQAVRLSPDKKAHSQAPSGGSAEGQARRRGVGRGCPLAPPPPPPPPLGHRPLAPPGQGRSAWALLGLLLCTAGRRSCEAGLHIPAAGLPAVDPPRRQRQQRWRRQARAQGVRGGQQEGAAPRPRTCRLPGRGLWGQPGWRQALLPPAAHLRCVRGGCVAGACTGWAGPARAAAAAPAFVPLRAAALHPPGLLCQCWLVQALVQTGAAGGMCPPAPAASPCPSRPVCRSHPAAPTLPLAPTLTPPGPYSRYLCPRRAACAGGSHH